MPLSMYGQQYNELWKQVEQAAEKDLPKTQMAALQKIIAKAAKEKQYGQLLKAELLNASLTVSVEPDSMDSALASLEQQAVEAEQKDEALAAVYNCVLGCIYRNNLSGGDEDDDARPKHTEYFKKALSRPQMLAAHKADEYSPLVARGTDSRLFNHDLLSVLGYEAEDFGTLHHYYDSIGNRPAAMLTALEMLRHPQQPYKLRMKDSPYIAALDSLTDRYGDLEACGEVAIERYQFMSACSDVNAAQRIAYIDQVLARWGGWKHTATLRNARKQLTQPSFRAYIDHERVLPDRPFNVHLQHVRHVNTVTLTVNRVNITGESSYSVAKDDQLKVLKTKVLPGTTKTYSRQYEGKSNYELTDDSIRVDGLPPGIYLMELTTDNKAIDAEHWIVYATDLFVIRESLPGDVHRMAVVSATTGQPVPNATLKLKNDNPNKAKTQTIVCNERGEARVTGDFDRVYPYTSTDKWFPAGYLGYDHYNYYEARGTAERTSIYTDRRIYRPGQTVHVSVVAWRNANGMETQALSGQPIELTLKDANYKTVKTATLNTDEFGTAATDFVLPQGVLTGSYSIRCASGGGYTSIRVEEYKRPTFEVVFDSVKEQYQNGDTLTVTGRARSYAGVPVQGAKVNFSVIRRKALWCWWWNVGGLSEEMMTGGEAVTDEKGEFHIQMPMQLPEWEELGDDGDSEDYRRVPRFYNFEARADVTDQGGETHNGSISVPLGSKPTAFYCDIEEQSERSQLKEFSFALKNAAGQDIEGMVDYTIDGQRQQPTAANKAVSIDASKLKSGRHVIEATCGTDSIRREFVVFSIDDRQPCIETHDWFYQSAAEFPADGSPVTLQVGASDADVHILYNVFSGKKVLESGVIDQSNALYNRQFSYKEEYPSGLLVTFAWVKEGQFYRHTATIQCPMPKKKLSLQWTTFRDKLTPGQQEEWTLRITDADGAPAKAQLMAAMYDMSLDQLVAHRWNMDLGLYQPLPYTEWHQVNNRGRHVEGFENLKLESEQPLRLSCFVSDVTTFRLGYSMMGVVTGARSRGGRRYEARLGSAAVGVFNVAGNDDAGDKMLYAKEEISLSSIPSTAATNALTDAAASMGGEDGGESAAAMQVRENLEETAFFYPSLIAADDGSIAIRFTLPESITTWRFMGLAHDKEMRNGMLEGISVAKKDIMVQPNMPRFIRVGDHATIAAKILNTTENAIMGDANLLLIDPETEQVVYEESRPFSVQAEGTANAVFQFEPTQLTPSLLICKILAVGDGFSDGEQHYLPVLPNTEWVTNTLPFTQHEPGTKTIKLDSQLPAAVSSPTLTVEYTNNPAWLMVQALPFIGNPNEENAISLAAAYYANSIGRHLIAQSPRIKTVFQRWQQEPAGENSLLSSLQKNQELKSLVLDETPWVMDAEKESDQKQALLNFFDENSMNSRIESTLAGLEKLQNSNGSFSWWKGMEGFPSMTAEVIELLTRLNLLIGTDDRTASMLKKANRYLSNIVVKEVADMRKREKEKKTVNYCSAHALQWMYMNAISARELTRQERDAADYLLKLLTKEIHSQSLYAKARMAVVLNAGGQQAKAREYVQSLKEYSVFTEEMGRYYDSPRADYSWCDYRIPTQVAAIEAFQAVIPNDTLCIDEMRRWLLQEKRTQSWDTPINSADAVYAFLNRNMQLLDHREAAQLSVNGQPLALPQATAGIGYVKTKVQADQAHTFTATKTSNGTSWGALYIQFMQPATEIESTAAGLHITREILPAKGSSSQKVFSVGDKVRIRLTIQADRDYDFVQLTDKRAACLEPVNQLSGYHWGYYCTPKDNVTNYYFDILSKGKHVIETEYYIDRAGTYTTGTCTVQCAYSPEYAARAKSLTIEVQDHE